MAPTRSRATRSCCRSAATIRSTASGSRRSGSPRRTGASSRTTGCASPRTSSRSATSAGRRCTPTSATTPARRSCGSRSATTIGPFLDAIPRATYTDPETASVGLLVEQAKERGIDAAEYTVDIGTSSKGYTAEAKGHVTIVVDRARRRLVGAFMAGPAVSEAIHECVLAIRADIPIDGPRRHDPRVPDRRPRPGNRVHRRRSRPAGVGSSRERLHRRDDGPPAPHAGPAARPAEGRPRLLDRYRRRPRRRLAAEGRRRSPDHR